MGRALRGNKYDLPGGLEPVEWANQVWALMDQGHSEDAAKRVVKEKYEHATATKTELRLKEMNNFDHACCPTCSRMYAMVDEKGVPVEIPSTCRRCGGPMDFEKAKKFGEELAEKEHQPQLTVIGNRTRALSAGSGDQG